MGLFQRNVLTYGPGLHPMPAASNKLSITNKNTEIIQNLFNFIVSIKGDIILNVIHKSMNLVEQFFGVTKQYKNNK